MDPALERLLESADLDAELAVLVRTASSRTRLPGWVREVSRFGLVSTVRVPSHRIRELRGLPDVRSVKAPRTYGAQAVLDAAPSRAAGHAVPDDARVLPADIRRPTEGPTGRGVVVAVVDWGLDITHPAFRRDDGRTRVLALWDQQPGPDPQHANRFGYGRIHTASDIDRALETDDPFGALHYSPLPADRGHGAHGTATTSIAAGRAWPGGVAGTAPDADIVFVHLGTAGGPSPDQLGDSVALVEAIDFVLEQAGDRCVVVSLSMGRQGSAHRGLTHVERAFDAAVRGRPGTAIVQSTGNYFDKRAHTAGVLDPAGRDRLELDLSGSPAAEHTVEIWYPGSDRFLVDVRAPGARACVVRPDRTGEITISGRRVAVIGHRTLDPDNGRNEIEIHLGPGAPTGRWTVSLVAVDVVDGRYDAWVERDTKPGASRLRFVPEQAVRTTTTGSICNGLRTVTVGAYDAHHDDHILASFSSSGPTVDGRRKPDLVAPGSQVLVARSAPTTPPRPGRILSTRQTGTSHAAPAVAGVLASMLELVGPVPVSMLRHLLLQACTPFTGAGARRAGSGYLDPGAAFAAAAAAGRSPLRPAPLDRPPPEETEMSLVNDSHATVMEPSALPAGVLDDVRAVLDSLDISARDLVQAYVLDRSPGLRHRLSSRVQVLAGPYDEVDALSAGDLLVRGFPGEGGGLVAWLVTGELCTRGAATAQGWSLERGPEGRYALTVDDGRDPGDTFARRIADPTGVCPRDQALVRVAPASAASDPFSGLFGLAAATPALVPPAVTSPLGESDAEEVDRHSRAYVAWYQAELNRLEGAGLGVDGVHGRLTRAAVVAFQRGAGIDADGVVGPTTEAALLRVGAVPPPGSSIAPPVPVPPMLVTAASLATLESRFFPPAGTPDAASFSRASEVEPLIDGSRYFPEIARQIARLQPGDSWYLTGWVFDQTVRPTPASPTFGELLVAATARGVDVRVILWASRIVLASTNAPYHGIVRINVQSAEALRGATVGGSRPLAGRVLLDYSPGHLASSHHQKTQVFVHNGVVTAFAGGIDVESLRLDGPPHTGASTPWHDAAVRTRGDAARALLDNFTTRWIEASTLTPSTYDIGRGSTPYNPTTLVPYLPPQPRSSLPPSATTSVQVPRSFPNAKEFGLVRNTPWTTLPLAGVHEIVRTFRQAIGAAQRYVYIEDQSFDAEHELFPSLVGALRRGVKVIAVIPGAPDPADRAAGPVNRQLAPEVQRGIIAHLSSAQRQNLAIWALTGVVVHSKLMLIDDEFAEIGSANFMDRSMNDTGVLGDDSELTVCLVSTGSAVRELRTQLWSEHLRVGAPAQTAEVADLARCLGFWRPSWGTGLSFPVPVSPLRFVGPDGLGSAGGGGTHSGDEQEVDQRGPYRTQPEEPLLGGLGDAEFAGQSPVLLDAEVDPYQGLLDEIERELKLDFNGPDNPGLYRRRVRLRALFTRVPADKRRELANRLGSERTGDDLSQLFRARLHRATRRELLGILEDGFAPPTTPPPAPRPTVPSPFEPLPPSEQSRFDAAVRGLTQKVDASGDPRTWRYRCWLAKLAAGADDRLIPWARICPSTSWAIGAAYLLGPCDITAGSAVDQTQLQRAIRSVIDVEPADRQLSFITHLRPQILWLTELTSEQLHLENLRRFHDQVQMAITKLDLWANNPMGGSSAMPPAYVSIKDWIGQRQRDPNNLYSCM